MNLHETLRTAGLAAALSLAMAAPPALAQQAGAFSGERSYPFTDLPGVTTPEEKATKNEVVCSQSYDDAELRRWGEFRRPVYTCTQNGLTYSSRNPPISRERDLRGIGW